jgi:hypothetical protein
MGPWVLGGEVGSLWLGKSLDSRLLGISAINERDRRLNFDPVHLLILQRIFSVIPVKTGIQHVYGLQNPNWIPASAGITDGVATHFVASVPFFFKESL